MRRDARFWTSKLVMTCAIIGPLMAGIVIGIVPSADGTIAAPGQGVYGEPRHRPTTMCRADPLLLTAIEPP
jgi:hypothetical protein